MPQDLGRVRALDRAPEVKTLRRRLAEMAKLKLGSQLLEGFARCHARRHPEAMGYLYIDGHLRVYNGKRELPKSHSTPLRLATAATPSYLLVLLDEFERQGLDPRASSLKVGILGAEPWTEEMRREIEERADLHAVDIYGLSELMGPGVAQECAETKDGLTLWEDHFLPEIVDPDTGQPLPDGEAGELVLTTLTKQAMPLLRYRTRDLTRLLPGTARTMRRIARLRGRTDDMMILRGVNMFPSQIEELILAVPGLAPQFVCVLSRPSRLDAMTVRVEARSEFEAPEERVRLQFELANRVEQAVGVTIAVEVLTPGSLERSMGKAKRILDLRALGPSSRSRS